MSLPTWQREEGLLSSGYQTIIGIDEAGRGAWAGPVVAAAVIFKPHADLKKFSVNDSKKLSPCTREKIFFWLVNNFNCGIGVVAHQLIDELGILPATKLAMEQAISNLDRQPDYLLIDAVKLERVKETPQENIIKGDAKVWSIAAASIIAKVTRDRLMNHYHELYGDYSFNRHKGYGTSLHQETLKRFGACPIHRRSYQPIKNLELKLNY